MVRQGDGGDDDEGEEVDGYDPMGSFGSRCQWSWGGGELAQCVTYHEGGGSGDGVFYCG